MCKMKRFRNIAYSKHDLVLGAMDNIQYHTNEFKLERGNVLVVKW